MVFVLLLCKPRGGGRPNTQFTGKNKLDYSCNTDGWTLLRGSHLGPGQQSSGQTQQLPLTHGEGLPPLPHLGIQTA